MKKTINRKEAPVRRIRRSFGGRLSSTLTKGPDAIFRIDPAFFGQVVESLTEYAVLTLDRDFAQSSLNAAAERIFGYTEQEIIGRPVALLFTPEDIQKGFPRREFDEALLKGRAEDERYHLAKDGRRFWSYGLSFPLKDANGIARGYVKIVRDESERKRTEDLLLEREERLRLAIEATGMGTWDYLPNGRRLDLCLSCKGIFDLPPDADVTYENFLLRVHPEDRKLLDSAIQACLQGKIPVCDVEHRIVLPDGSIRWVTLRAKMLMVHCPDGKETCPRLIGLVVDSTEKREHMTRLLLANEELQSFAYSASHDLRAPLRTINFYSQMIRDRQYKKLDEQGKDYFERIQAATIRMNALIEALLKLSLAAEKAISMEEIDLSRFAAEIAKDLRICDPERKSRFVIQPGLITQGDRELLYTVLRNLLENAWKFTKGRAETIIEVGPAEARGKQAFFVRDNGMGFDMAKAEAAFEPFKRLHGPEVAGSGVGLAIVKRIINRHGGEIWTDAVPGRGATFYFTLPKSRGKAPSR